MRSTESAFEIEGELAYLGRPLRSELADPSDDLLGGYHALLRKEKAGKRPPVVRFANARTDRALLAFVKEFGWWDSLPSTTKGGSRRKPGGKSVWVFTVLQDREDLRREQRVFEGAVRLVAGLQADPVNLGAVATSLVTLGMDWVPFDSTLRFYISAVVGYTPSSQVPREKLLEAAGRTVAHARRVDQSKFRQEISTRSGMTPAALRNRVVNWGHYAACRVLSKFPPMLTASPTPKGWVVESLPFAETGLKSVLYGLLRLEYATGRPAERRLGICEREDCCELFAVERRGQNYCDEKCSRLARQRAYYHDKGKVIRRKRLAGKKRLLRTRAGR